MHCPPPVTTTTRALCEKLFNSYRKIMKKCRVTYLVIAQRANFSPITRSYSMCNETKTVHLCTHKDVEVDACIARFVQALNDAGIVTATSCCGHGVGDASFLTHSEGEYRLVIIVDAEQSRDRFARDFRELHSAWEERHK